MSRRAEGLSPADRLRKPREFRDVTQRGRRRASRAFVVLAARGTGRQPSRGRLGVTVSRRVGNAVVRNRVKRHIREWYRRGGRRAVDGLDVVVIARSAAADLSGRRTAAELDGLCEGAVEERR